MARGFFMTVSVRNTILLFSLLFCLAILVAFVLAVGTIYVEKAAGQPLKVLLENHHHRQAVLTLTRLAAILLYSVGAGLALQRFFRKTVSPEMFFFIFFVISLSFEALRAGPLLFAISGEPSYYGTVLTRAVEFGRFFGVFCLFVSGLYATGIDYSKFEVVLGVALLVAFTLAFSIPVDPSTFLPNLMYRIGGGDQILFVFLALEFFSILNFLLAAYLRRARDYLLLAVGLAATIAGMDLLLYVGWLPAGAIGLALLIAGTVIFGNRTHAIYLWS